MGVGHTILNTLSSGSPDTTAAATAITAWLNGVMDISLAAVTAKLQSTVEVVNEADNSITGAVVVPAQTAQSGSAAVGSGFGAGVGARVRWQTAAFRNGRRVVGTSFIVPMWADYFESDGTIKAAAITLLQNASNTLLTALTAADAVLGVYSRPTAVGANDGVISSVTGATIPDQVSWLTSRRS